MKHPGDVEAIALLKQTIAGIESEELSVVGLSFDDTKRWTLKVKCGPGDKALARVAAAEREGAIADAGHAVPNGPRLPGAFREPRGDDVCPSCHVVGRLRHAGGVDWLCIGCQHSFAPFAGAKE